MPRLAHPQRLRVEDYLAAEDGADLRHESIDGELYAMTGARRQHGLIVGNTYVHPRLRLSGTPWQLFANAMKARLRMAEKDVFYVFRSEMAMHAISRALAITGQDRRGQPPGASARGIPSRCFAGIRVPLGYGGREQESNLPGTA